MWRHGDVFLQSCDAVPDGARPLPHGILARGEVTGHAHRIKESGTAHLFRHADSIYLRVTGDGATVVHEEHGPIRLEPGTYRSWIQREYSPEAIRRVLD